MVAGLGVGQKALEQQTRWTEQQAKTWYARQGGLVGANYNPANAINQAVKPTQPLTAGVWKGDWSSDVRLTTIERIRLSESGVISFHGYDDAAKFEQRIQSLQRYN